MTLTTDGRVRQPPSVLFLFSDTGGGHRTAAEAIDSALRRLPGGAVVRTEMVDAFAACGVFPLREAIRSYGVALKVQPSPYPALYHLSNGRTRARIVTELGKPFIRGNFRQLLERVDPSLVVSVHPLLNELARDTIDATGSRAPLVTVITDLVTIHHAWTTNIPANQYVVASAEAARVCTSRGIPAERVHNLGLPIRDGFSPPADKRAAKELAGLDPGRRVLLIMSGGEGGGKLSGILRRIAGSLRALKLQVVAICGRNDALRERLEAMAPRFGAGARILGFVDNVADYMRAADALLSKAGPGTIVEAAACGLPIIVCDYISGQEAGNLGYVEARGAGVVALEARDVSVTLRRMFGADPSVMAEYRRSALESARPHAAEDIARFLLTMLPETAKNVTPVG
ncbi:MAG: glycosyltransferase [Candidatus Eremiobacteraeota bacterium]|nr:glycosyltransferase [Candidatus Eremiobacteraeota bacterium]MBV8366269.1 glycosyltransferase [Candidatus Eremiobacteraeota bacterium]